MKKAFVLLCIIIIFIVGIIVVNFNEILKSIYKTDYSEYVEKYSEQYKVDPLLVYSIIKAESNFDENATSQKGACGLMQLMDDTAKEIASSEGISYESSKTLYEPEKNIMIGIKYYSNLKEQFENTEIALAAYNAGSGNVQKWIDDGIIEADGSNIERIPFRETNMYVRKIIKNYKFYKSLYQKERLSDENYLYNTTNLAE